MLSKSIKIAILVFVAVGVVVWGWSVWNDQKSNYDGNYRYDTFTNVINSSPFSSLDSISSSVLNNPNSVSKALLPSHCYKLY
jgi:hypothetical protein